MSKVVYDKLSNCDEPFSCPNCVMRKQSKEIAELRDLVKTLTFKVSELLVKLTTASPQLSTSAHDTYYGYLTTAYWYASTVE